MRGSTPLGRERTAREHFAAAAQALLVTFLWSTSWVLIKIGLDDLGLRPLSFAGLRYALAALVLLPWALGAVAPSSAPRPGHRVLLAAGAYGVVFVAVAQGAQFAALAVLPATAVNLILSTIPAAVAAIALARRAEPPSVAQLAGVALLLAGAVLYFGPVHTGEMGWYGIAAALVCVAASAASAHIGRRLAADAGALGGALGLTAVSMLAGALVLLAIGVALEGLPPLDARGWAIVIWLAVVNTAVAFTVWNHTLRTLTAVESSVLNNTMTVQIAILAVVFLDERLGAPQVLGLGCAAAGALVVQLAPGIVRRERRVHAEEAVREPSP